MIWPLYAIPYIVLFLFSYMTAGLMVLFATMQYGPVNNNNGFRIEPRLPQWLDWFQTPDNSLYGDSGWKTEHCIDYWACYWGMVGWLWRNPCYGVTWTLLAAKLSPDDAITIYGDPTIKDNQNGRAGYCLTIVGKYWNLYWIVPLWAGRCFRLNVGWKLKTFAEKPERLKTQNRAQFTLSPRYAKFFPESIG